MSPARTKEPNPYLIPLDLDATEVLSVDVGPQAQSWAAYFSPPVVALDALVLVRLAAQANSTRSRKPDTALEIREVRIAVARSTAGFASSLLREIPVLRIEAAINQTDHRQQLLTHVFATGPVATDDVPGGVRFRTPPSQVPTLTPQPLTIEDPGGYRKPDEFYRRVADLYLHLAAYSGRPAHELANANNVPVATVHRWIREAKVRKVLLLPEHRTGHEG